MILSKSASASHGVDVHAGVVDEDVDGSHGGFRCCNRGLDRGPARHIKRVCKNRGRHLRAGCGCQFVAALNRYGLKFAPHLSSQFFESIDATAGYRNACRSQMQHARKPDPEAARGTGHQRDLAEKLRRRNCDWGVHQRSHCFLETMLSPIPVVKTTRKR
jgi:hypothetical protein